MSATARYFAAHLLAGLSLVAPFIVLQLVNRRTFQEEFPYVLFSFMTIHSLLIVLSLAPVVRNLRAHKTLNSLLPGHWVGLLVGVVLGYVYVDVILDQLPCFLGRPNCD